MQELQKLKEKLDKTEAEKADAVERRKALEEDLKKAASPEEKSTIQATLVEAYKEVAALQQRINRFEGTLQELQKKTHNAPGLSMSLCHVYLFHSFRRVFSPPPPFCCYNFISGEFQVIILRMVSTISFTILSQSWKHSR